MVSGRASACMCECVCVCVCVCWSSTGALWEYGQHPASSVFTFLSSPAPFALLLSSISQPGGFISCDCAEARNQAPVQPPSPSSLSTATHSHSIKAPRGPAA